MRVTVAAAMVSWALSVAASAADAQVRQAEPVRFEVPGMDWRPNTAWRARANLVRLNRWAAISRGDVLALNQRRSMVMRAPGGGSSSLSVTGMFHVPVIPLAYSDVAAPFPVTQFQQALFGATPPVGSAYTLKTYYEQVSGGRIQMEGRVFNTVRLDSTAEYYQDGCNGIGGGGVRGFCSEGGQRMGRMLLAALDSISNGPGADTVWSQFDNDGPDGIPNSGDDDGMVDFVTFLQPEIDGACQPNPGIWAHRYEIAGWNGGSPYVTRTPRAGRPGEFIQVNNYTMQSQVGGPGGCVGGIIMPVGTVAHETGHAFGLPDLYDITVPLAPTEGVGEWSIMGSGNYHWPYSPASYDAWSLNELGWITVDTLTTGRTVTTHARQLSDTVFLARFVGSPNEFLLIENRQAVFSDTAMFNPTAPDTTNVGRPCTTRCPKQPGLLFWHIDLDQIAARRSFNLVTSGTFAPHGVALIQADGLNNLRGQGRNRGDRGDSYPGSTGKTRWSLTTTPASRSNTGAYAGFIIDRVESLSSGVMRFRYVRREPTVVVASVAGIRVNVNGRSWARYEEVIAAGEQFVIEADSLQTNPDGRTRARFLAWTIGGPRSQTVMSSATPDTIIATFAAEHRLMVLVQGGGQGAVTVGPSGSAALPGGDFLPAGTPVTVTAQPQSGSLFVGWRGDTVATSQTITLPMGRPYDLEASFVTEVAVGVQAATSEILGTVSLTADQRTFLDLLGNRNGIYDVGDYLAYLRHTGQPVPAAALHLLGTERPAARSGRDQ